MNYSKCHKFYSFLFLLVLAVTFGFNFGFSNQNTYYAQALKLINPDLFASDWFVNQSIHYHDNFSTLVVMIDKLGFSLDWSSAILDLLLRIASLFFIYRLIRDVSPRYVNHIFLLLVIFIFIERTNSVGGSYIYSSYLQPSSLGSFFTIVGMYYFVGGRYLSSGFYFAIGGFYHTNYLLVAFVFLGIAHLFIDGGQNFVKRYIYQFTPMFIVFLFKLPFLIGMIDSPYAGKSSEIFLFIRSPHHYVPSYYSVDFYKFFAWGYIGLSGLFFLGSTSSKMATISDYSNFKRLVCLYFGMSTTLVFSFVFTVVWFNDFFAKLFLWRIAPFWEMTSLLIFSFVIFESFFSPAEDDIALSFRKKMLVICFFLLGCFLYLKNVSYFFGLMSFQFFVFLIFVILFSFMIYCLIFDFSKSRVIGFGLVYALLFFVAILSSVNVFIKDIDNEQKYSLKPFPSHEKELYEWALSTPKDSLFLTPPNMQNFRLWSRRSIVVDWKSTPVDPEGLVEWYNRIESVSGIEGVKNLRSAMRGYNSIDMSRVAYLKEKYDLNYVVVERSGSNIQLPIVFENERYTVYSMN